MGINMNIRANRRAAYGLAVGAGVLALIFAGLHAFGVRLNLTESLPKGFYRVEASDGIKGQLIAFCPDRSNHAIAEAAARGYLTEGAGCGNGLAPMIKRFIAGKGDTVALTVDGFLVNNKLVPNTAPLAVDGHGQALPTLKWPPMVVPAGWILAVSNHVHTSFDARYFGLIPLSSVIGAATPLWVWR